MAPILGFEGRGDAEQNISLEVSLFFSWGEDDDQFLPTGIIENYMGENEGWFKHMPRKKGMEDLVPVKKRECTHAWTHGLQVSKFFWGGPGRDNDNTGDI